MGAKMKKIRDASYSVNKYNEALKRIEDAKARPTEYEKNNIVYKGKFIVEEIIEDGLKTRYLCRHIKAKYKEMFFEDDLLKAEKDYEASYMQCKSLEELEKEVEQDIAIATICLPKRVDKIKECAERVINEKFKEVNNG